MMKIEIYNDVVKFEDVEMDMNTARKIFEALGRGRILEIKTINEPGDIYVFDWKVYIVKVPYIAPTPMQHSYTYYQSKGWTLEPEEHPWVQINTTTPSNGYRIYIVEPKENLRMFFEKKEIVYQWGILPE